MGTRGLYCSAIQAGNQFEDFCNRIGSQYVRFGTRRPSVWVSNLFLSAFEWVKSIEGCFRNLLNCTYSHRPLALPLGELSPQVTERVLGLRLPSPSSLRSDTSPKGRGKKGFEERKFLAYIHQTSPERSEKTASVFLVSSRRSGGKSKSLQTLFLSFSFGEAKENAGPHSQICRRLSKITAKAPFTTSNGRAKNVRCRWFCQGCNPS